MKGFTDKCLLLFPKPEVYEYKTEHYYLNFKRALDRLMKYFSYLNVQVCCLTTDEIALVYDLSGVIWYQTLSDADTFFMRTHNQSKAKLAYKENMEKFPALYETAMSKFPLQRGLSTDQRFDVLVKREYLISKEIISDFNLVFSIQQPSNKSYNTPSKEGDGKIRISINNGSFICTCFMSGEEMDATDLLNFTGANRPMYEWEEKYYGKH
jgi:hypothetical protein